MLKILCLVISFFCLSIPVYSQSDSIRPNPVRYGFMVGADANALPARFASALFCSIEKGRHKIAFGPSFSGKVTGESPYNLTNRPLTLTGGSMLYQFYPNPRGKRYDLFFQYECSFYRLTNKTKYYKSNDVVNVAVVDRYVMNFISYGLRIRFLEYFSIEQNFGLGYLWNNLTLNGKKAYNQFTNAGFQGNLRLGLAFSIPVKK
jgi:hypothetical protein